MLDSYLVLFFFPLGFWHPYYKCPFSLPHACIEQILDGLIPGSGRSPGGGSGNPLQYSCLENPMDRGAWWATVHRVAKRQPQLKRQRSLDAKACSRQCRPPSHCHSHSLGGPTTMVDNGSLVPACILQFHTLISHYYFQDWKMQLALHSSPLCYSIFPSLSGTDSSLHLLLGPFVFFSFLPCVYSLGSSPSEHDERSCLIIPSGHCAFGRKTLAIRHYKWYQIYRAF